LRHPQTYADDICYGADTVDYSIQVELTAALNGAGFELRKLASNTAAVVPYAVPEEFRVIKILRLPVITA